MESSHNATGVFMRPVFNPSGHTGVSKPTGARPLLKLSPNASSTPPAADHPTVEIETETAFLCSFCREIYRDLATFEDHVCDLAATVGLGGQQPPGVRSASRHIANVGDLGPGRPETGTTIARRIFNRALESQVQMLQASQSQLEPPSNGAESALSTTDIESAWDEPLLEIPSREVSRASRKPEKSASRSHVCEVCDAAFARLSRLLDHLHREHPLASGPLDCKKCKKRFHDTPSFIRHAKRHLRPSFQCDLCMFCTNTNHAMVRHRKRVHYGERNYPCSQCPQAFFALSDLKRHARRVHQSMGDAKSICSPVTGAAQKNFL